MPRQPQPRRPQPRPGDVPKTTESEETPASSSASEPRVSGNAEQNESGAAKTSTSGKSGPQDVMQISSILRPPTTGSAGPPPRQRLASLNPRRKLPAPEASDSRPAGLKFQPKSAARRTKEEREAADRAETEKRQQRFGDSSAALPRSTGDRGGFRGVGRGTFAPTVTTRAEASGHLGGSSIEEGGGRKKATRGGGLFSRVSGPSTSTSAKVGPSRARSQATVKAERDRDGDVVMGSSSTGKRVAFKRGEEERPTHYSSDSEPDVAEGPRVNIEHINLISDEETDGEQAEVSNQDKGKEHEVETKKENKIPGWTLKPVRIDRLEHVERAAGIVAADPNSMTSTELRRRAKERADAQGSLFISDDEEPQPAKTAPKAKAVKKSKDVEFVRDERRWKGVYPDDEGSPQIKDELNDDDGVVFNDISCVNVPGASLQVESGAHVAERVEPVVPEKSSADDVNVREQRKRRSSRTKSRLIKPILQTEEDRQEWARYEEDLRLLGEELGFVKPHGPQNHSLDPDGDVKTGDGTDNFKDKREGLVYLFQLPPIMPKILTAAEREIPNMESTELGKAEEDKPPDSSKPTDAKQSQPSDPKQKQPKPESEETLVTDSRNANIFMADDSALPVGRVGTLRVHDTGRVTATWGGASLELGRGAGSGLLQEVVMTEYSKHTIKLGTEGKDKDNKDGGGKVKLDERISLGDRGWAIGQLGGGFVMTPDWAKMF